MFEKLEIEKWLELNASLQKKKNELRKELNEMGILKKGGNNDFDHYQYFSEAQYKELMGKLFAKHSLELTPNEIEYAMFEGTEKQANGRQVKFEFKLSDIETGFYETSIITGEGIDKGDKAGYKADTGALKYYLANTFMVATGDDAEQESPNNKMNKKSVPKASEKQKEMIKKLYQPEEIKDELTKLNVAKLSDLTIKQASDLISKRKNESTVTPVDIDQI